MRGEKETVEKTQPTEIFFFYHCLLGRPTAENILRTLLKTMKRRPKGVPTKTGRGGGEPAGPSIDIEIKKVYFGGLPSRAGGGGGGVGVIV